MVNGPYVSKGLNWNRVYSLMAIVCGSSLVWYLYQYIPMIASMLAILIIIGVVMTW